MKNLFAIALVTLLASCAHKKAHMENGAASMVEKVTTAATEVMATAMPVETTQMDQVFDQGLRK